MTPSDEATKAQRRAADAARSVWVSASAGSGKTKVLTDRVLNLLLTGAAPDRLLCLTFTKAAAAEMANRVNERLGHWTVAAEDDLARDIAGLTGRPADAETCRTARRLFARVLDTPGGMRILTIHAFCQSILRRFPLEAGIIPNFEVTDDLSAAELQAEASNAVLVSARENPDSPLAAAFAEINSRIEETRFAKLLNELQGERGALQSAFEEAGSVDAYVDRLWRRLGLRPGERCADYLAIACDEDAFDGPTLRRACEVLLRSTAKTDCARGEALALWLAAPVHLRIEGWDHYQSQFLTNEFSIQKRLATAPIAKANPWLIPALEAEAERVDRVRLHCAAIEAAIASLAITPRRSAGAACSIMTISSSRHGAC
jgi:ATP-dependent helicase/nuclease subunit A